MSRPGTPSPPSRPSHPSNGGRIALGAIAVALLLTLPTSPASPVRADAPAPEPAPVPTLLAPIAAVAAELASRVDDLDLAAAARALRQRDCDTAIARIGAAGATALGPQVASVLEGLYAHACERIDQAAVRLSAVSLPGHPLDDWRLLVLADSAAATGAVPAAEAALARLIETYPDSSLLPRALARAAELAWGRRDGAAALARVETSRRRELTGEDMVRLEELAWRIGTAQADPQVRAAASRRLLVTAPLAADALGVPASLGERGIAGFLTAPELVARGRTFLALDRPADALRTLAAVPLGARDGAWTLLEAEALTADLRGREALALLNGFRPGSPAEAAKVEWARATAALEAATARRGRTNLPSADRARLRVQAERHLRAAAGPGAEPETERLALRKLFVEISDGERFADCLELLRRLRKVDPTDHLGSRWLWGLGWSEYAGRNYTGAVGYWSELAELYPGDRHARAGRYWTARAYAALGEPVRARALYAEVAAADTADFYKKMALARLGAPVSEDAVAAVAAAGPPAEPWPDDPRLARSRLLSDLGLDGLASSELGAAGGGADPRAVAALESLLLARRGELRESAGKIRNAFPALGGPYQSSVPEPAQRLYYPLDFADTVRAQADLHRLPVHLVLGMIRQESAFDSRARSRAGARGLLQVMPATGREVARRLGLTWAPTRLDDPSFNLALGTAYFEQVLRMFDGNVELALAGYNGGPYRIQRLWREAGPSADLDRFLEGLTIEESKTYVKRILVLSDSYRRLYPEAGASS